MKKLILLLLLLISIKAQDTLNVNYTNLEINEAFELSTVFKNDVIRWGKQALNNDSTDTKTGKSWYRAKRYLSEAITVASNLITVGTVNRCVIYNEEYFTNDSLYTIPDSTIVYSPNATFTNKSSWTLGAGSQVIDISNLGIPAIADIPGLQDSLNLKTDTTDFNTHVDDSTIHFTQANITATGTISSGTWNATTIDTSKTAAKVISVAGDRGIVTLDKNDVGLSNVTNNKQLRNETSSFTTDLTAGSSLQSTDIIAVEQSADNLMRRYTIADIGAAAGGEANTLSDRGAGIGFAGTKAGVDLGVKSATSNDGSVSITSTTTEVDFASGGINLELAEDITSGRPFGMNSGGQIIPIIPDIVLGDTSKIINSPTGTNSIALLKNNKIIGVVKENGTNSSKGRLALASNGSINWYNSITEFNSSNSSDHFVMRLDTARALILYRDASNGYGKFKIATVTNDTTLTYSSENTFNSGDTGFLMSIELGANITSGIDTVIISFRDLTGGVNYPSVIAYSLDGDTPTNLMAKTALESAASNYVNISKIDTDTFVSSYQEVSSGWGRSIAATFTGSGVTTGTAVYFNSSATSELISTTLDGSATFVVNYQDDGNSGYLTSCIGTVTTNTISYGSEQVIKSTSSVPGGCGAISGAKYFVAIETSNIMLQCEIDGGTITVTEKSYSSAYTTGQRIGNFDSLNGKVAGVGNFAGAYCLFLSNPSEYIGFTNESGVTGQTKNCSVRYQICKGFTGLTIGVEYYYDPVTDLPTSTVNLFPIGRAISTTKIILDKNEW